MRKYTDFIEGTDGKALRGASVLVLNYSDNLPATLYSDDAGLAVMSNPTTTDARGQFSFYVADGRYTLQISGSGLATAIISDVSIFDEQELTNKATKLPVTHADYTALRAYAGTADQVFVTGSGIAGTFTRDDSDTTSADNGGTIIVASNGKRWKRVFVGVADIRWFGATSGSTDSTASIVAALSAHDVVKAPAGQWTVSTISLGDNKTIVTDGFDTVFQQISGLAVGARIFVIVGSNVTIGDFKARGNIATDTDEQNHAIFVRPTAASLRNVTIGSVYGQDIRGDVLYVGGLATNKVYNVKVGRIYIDNVLRNGVSITGGEHVEVDAAICVGKCGYTVFDVEPNANSQLCDGVWLGYARGRHVAVAGGQAYPVGSVRFGHLDLDQGYQDNTTPAYAPFTAIRYAGLILNNFKSVHAKVVKTTNFDYRGISTPGAVGDYVGDEVVIDHLEQSNCSLTDPDYNAYNTIGGAKSIVIKGGKIELHASTKYGFINVSGLRIRNLRCNGEITRTCIRPVFEGVTVESTWDVYVANGAGNSEYAPTFISCTVSFTGAGVGRLCGEKATVINSTITVNNFLVPSAANAWVINSTINGTYYAAGIYAAQWEYPLAMGGNNRMWMDTFGMARVKTSSPTSSTDGFPLGKKVAVPATATSTGAPGQWAADTTNLYVYTGDGTTHTWRRVAIAVF